MKCEIKNVGTELLLGDILNTNWYTVIAQCEDGSEKIIKVYEATAISTIDGV